MLQDSLGGDQSFGAAEIQGEGWEEQEALPPFPPTPRLWAGAAWFVGELGRSSR